MSANAMTTTGGNEIHVPAGYKLYSVLWSVDEDDTGDEGREVKDPYIEDTKESHSHYEKWRDHYGLPNLVFVPDHFDEDDDIDDVCEWISDEYEWLLNGVWKCYGDVLQDIPHKDLQNIGTEGVL